MSVFNNRLVRYAFAGGSAAVVDVGGFAFLASVGVPIVPAAISSFLAATVVNFLLSSQWVFDARVSVGRYALFFLGTLASLLVNVTVTSIGVICLGLPRGFSKMGAVATTFLMSYWINARLVFGKGTTARSPSQSESM